MSKNNPIKSLEDALTRDILPIDVIPNTTEPPVDTTSESLSDLTRKRLFDLTETGEKSSK